MQRNTTLSVDNLAHESRVRDGCYFYERIITISYLFPTWLSDKLSNLYRGS